MHYSVYFVVLLSTILALVYGYQEEDFLDGQLPLVVEDALGGGPYQPVTQRSTIYEDDFLDGQLTLVVEDALGGGPDPPFTQRSTIHVRSVKSGNAVVTHTRPWSIDLNNNLKALSENGDFYRIRVYHKGSEDRGYVSTFTKACQIYESSLTETLSIMVDSSGMWVVGIGLIPPVSACEGVEPDVVPTQHNTTIIIRSPTPAPVPDTATYIEKIEAMKSEKAEGKDNRSFLAKYWMYIVPVVVIMVLSGGGQEAGR